MLETCALISIIIIAITNVIDLITKNQILNFAIPTKKGKTKCQKTKTRK